VGRGIGFQPVFCPAIKLGVEPATDNAEAIVFFEDRYVHFDGAAEVMRAAVQ